MKLRAGHDKTQSGKRTLPAFLQSETFWKTTATVVLLLIVLAVTVHLRLATVDLRVTDSLAKQTIEQNVRNQLANQIRQQYPTLPDSAVQTEAQKRWIEFEKQNRDEIETQAAQYSQVLKNQYQYTTGTSEPYNQTYLLEMDPYMEWHQAMNLADHGTMCDRDAPVMDSRTCIDDKRVAPDGTVLSLTLHPWLEAQMIKIGQSINPNLDSKTIVFYLPVILIALSVIPAFFVGRKLGGNVGGFVAAMIIAVHPIIMNRTVAGFSDTDGYSILFPLLFIWFLFESLEAKRWWTRLTLAALTGLTVGLYSFSWGGWWFLFFITCVAFLAFIGYKLIVALRKHGLTRSVQQDMLRVLAVFGMFLFSSALFVTVLQSFGAFLGAFANPFAANVGLQAATTSDVDLVGWPNILTTVAELNIPSLSGMISNLGGIFVVLLAGFGLFVTFLDPRKLSWGSVGAAAAALLYYYVVVTRAASLTSIMFIILFALPLVGALLYYFFRNKDVDLHLAIFMMAWLLATLYATTKGIRFLLLGITPFAIGCGIALGWFAIAVSSAISKEIRRPILVSGVVSGVVLLIAFAPGASYNLYSAGKYSAEHNFPGMNDAWWGVMSAINERTPPNTIITSWWDFGHWFRNVGNRSVTFDGASQNPEPGHIVGRILLSSNETESVGLLRMMDCGQNSAYRTAHKTLDVVPARELVTELVMTDRAGAQKILDKTSIPKEDQKAILEFTHCTPPPSVFITSNDMTGKGGVWGHFGSWDFRKSMAYIYTQQNSQSEALTKIEALGYTPAEAISTYNTIKSFSSDGEANGWIAPWPGYFTQSWVGCHDPTGNGTNKTVVCPVGIGLQQTAQGVVVLEEVSFNPTNPLDATVGYALYANNAKASTTSRLPLAKVVYADVSKKTLTRVEADNAQGVTIGALIRSSPAGNSTSYSVLLTDPLQTESLYTKLYFLDGVFTEHFTKFVEDKSAGIIVWSVTWPKD